MADYAAHLTAEHTRGHGFGTMPVFLAGISTILGAVMFLRFGYAVGHAGLLGAFAVILLGHMVTVPTALALAEIATNRKVEGGGEYFIISRSFGRTIGSAIGVSLYLSQEVVSSCQFVSNADMAQLVLRHGDFHFGQHKTIHIWLTWNDQDNANLMILLAYVLLGHPEWRSGEITVFAALPRDEVDVREREFSKSVAEGRIPIAQKNIQFIAVNDFEGYRRLVRDCSADADLVLMGFHLQGLEERGTDVFTAHSSLKDVLFVHAPEIIELD